MAGQAHLNSFFTAFVVAMSIFCSHLASASDYGTTGLIDIPTARFDAMGRLRQPLRLMNGTSNFQLPIRPRHGFRKHFDIPVLMNSHTGTETTNSKRDCGKKSFICRS